MTRDFKRMRAASASAGERRLWRDTFANGYIPENQKHDSNVHDLPRNQIMRVAQRFPTTIKLPDPDKLQWDDGNKLFGNKNKTQAGNIVNVHQDCRFFPYQENRCRNKLIER